VNVLGFELVAAEGAVGASEVAIVSKVGRGTEAAETYLGSSRAGGGVHGLWGREAL
jgi:hypothetical protein